MIQRKFGRHAIRIGDAAEWDSLVAKAPGASPLQSAAWGDAKSRQGWRPLRVAAVEDGALAGAQALWRRTPLGPLLYVPRGPFASPDAGDGLTADLMDELHSAAKEIGAVALKVEPNAADPGALPALGFRRSGQSAQPLATLVVDLTPDEATLLARLDRGARYNVGLAGRKGVAVQAAGPEGCTAFYNLLTETAGRDDFAIRSASYYRDVVESFGESAEVMLATHEGDLLAGAVLVWSGAEAAYLYGASSNHKRNLKATHLLQWQCLLRTKAAGCVRYDMWGVPAELAEREAAAEDLPEPEDHQKGDLWGVYQFKKGFGGRLVTFAGGWDYVYRPSRYWLWTRLAPRLRGLMRRRAVRPGE